MIYWPTTRTRGGNDLGGLTSQLRVRVLNGSVTGCLVETSRPLMVRTIAGLRVNLLGREYDDQVRVTRCQPISGASGVFHVAMEFFSTTPPYAGSLRYAIHREVGQFPGWLHQGANKDDQPKDASRQERTDAADE